MKPMQNIEDQVIAGNSNYFILFPDSSLILIQLHMLDKLFISVGILFLAFRPPEFIERSNEGQGTVLEMGLDIHFK